MLFDSPHVERLIEGLRRLPGVGRRTAERYALHLLTAPADEANFLDRHLKGHTNGVARDRTRDMATTDGRRLPTGANQETERQ